MRIGFSMTGDFYHDCRCGRGLKAEDTQIAETVGRGTADLRPPRAHVEVTVDLGLYPTLTGKTTLTSQRQPSQPARCCYVGDPALRGRFATNGD